MLSDFLIPREDLLLFYSFVCISILLSSQKSFKYLMPLLPDDDKVSLTATTSLTTSTGKKGKKVEDVTIPYSASEKRVIVDVL